MHLPVGKILKNGEYKIEKVLGQGGFGITYLAEQTGLGRKVALKEFFMQEHCNRDADTSHVSVGSVGSKELVERFRQKFLKEARLGGVAPRTGWAAVPGMAAEPMAFADDAATEISPVQNVPPAPSRQTPPPAVEAPRKDAPAPERKSSDNRSGTPKKSKAPLILLLLLLVAVIAGGAWYITNGSGGNDNGVNGGNAMKETTLYFINNNLLLL